jgi:SAM-dependent methyltransferase
VGIDLVLFRKLAALARKIDAPQRSLMLGRQTLTYRGLGTPSFNAAVAEAGFEGKTIDDFCGPDGFAEPCLRQMGFGEVEALDYSPFEGAQHIHDLNHPVPDALRGQFDFIYDGGTIEHVFNVAQALENVFVMLRPGGVFASANGMNGWYGHGIYQFGAELVYSFWRRRAGCEVLLCEALPKHHVHPAVALPDVAETGTRLRRLGTQLPAGRVYLYYEIRKPEGAVLIDDAMQSDYARRWAADAGNQEVRA